MARLLYMAIQSLDGYTTDASGDFEWAHPSDDAHRFINDTQRSVGTYLFGRRNYETMAVWDTLADSPDVPDVIKEFADIWLTIDKVVYSRTLPEVTTARTRLERTFDLDDVRRMKAEHDRDLGIAGPTLAADAIRAGLVDDFHCFVAPAIVGGGLRTLPEDARLDLELVDQRRFESGMTYAHYRPRA